MGTSKELESAVINTATRKRVSDLDHAGGDTGGMQVFASLRDANVVLDGPVGCHVMPAVAVINYTDSIPYLQNVTCSELSETANAPIAIVAPPTYKDGLEGYLGGELGLPIAYSAYRTGAESSPNEEVRIALRELSPSPMMVFGSINERMIIAQEKLPALFMQSSFPGAVVRRATGTPYMGYAGKVWLLQLVCEGLFDVLFANLPTSAVPPLRAEVPTAQLLASAPAVVAESGKGRNSVIAWTDEAKQITELTLKRVPFFVRVSVNKKLRAKAQRLARERGSDVDRAVIEEITARYAPGR